MKMYDYQQHRELLSAINTTDWWRLCVCVCHVTLRAAWPVTQQDGMTLVAGSSVDGDSVQTFLTGPCPKHTNIYNTTTHSHTLLS